MRPQLVKGRAQQVKQIMGARGGEALKKRKKNKEKINNTRPYTKATIP